MSAARLYILCGLPFAGKTTLAKALVQRFGLACIALDDINSERGIGLDGEPISQSDWAKSYAEAHRRLDTALASGQSVIYDAANFTRKERDRLYAIAARYAIAATVIYLNQTDEARRRWQANRISRVRYDVRDEDFAHVVDNFEPPTSDEDVLTYDGTLPLEEWITQMFNGRSEMADFNIHAISEAEQEQVRRFTIAQWDAEMVIGLEGTLYPHLLPGFIAEQNGGWVGLITYNIIGDSCEVVTLNSMKPGQGIGSALLNAVKQIAISANCRRLWLTTTNENLHALSFYQKWGLVLARLYPNRIAELRKLKPQIPLFSDDGIPIRDVIELEMNLTN